MAVDTFLLLKLESKIIFQGLKKKYYILAVKINQNMYDIGKEKQQQPCGKKK